MSTMRREITWVDAFFVSSGVSIGLLFSLGSIGSTVGTSAWLIWVMSSTIALLQAFTYAELAGLFPDKSGGTSVYGAIAWVKYAKPVAPVCVWSNWLAWSPVLAFSSQLMSGYILSTFFSKTSWINTWQIKILDLGFIKDNLSIRFDSTFVLSVAIVVLIFLIQKHGILRTAKAQKIAACCTFIPLILFGLFAIFLGKLDLSNLELLPLDYNSNGEPIKGVWSPGLITVFLGGLYLCAWSTYGVENAVCYTSEYKNPEKDTRKALMAAGFFCIFMCTLVPIAFYGSIDMDTLLSPGVSGGTEMNKAMAGIFGGGDVLIFLFLVALVIGLFVVVMTALAGSSRTLYQASVDGWLPKYLSHLNKDGTPTYAMATDMVFNIILLMISDYNFLLACANLNYMVFIFFNLNSIWIHRIDRPQQRRPYRTPIFLLVFNVGLAFINLFLLGIGADLWGNGTLVIGSISVLCIVPVFWYRHNLRDKGHFPAAFQNELDKMTVRKAGAWPYICILAGIAIIIAGKLLYNDLSPFA